MKYQKVINLSDYTPNQPSNFRTKNWVETNVDSNRAYSNSQIRFKTSMLKSCLCDYSDAYILVSGTIIIKEGPDDATEENRRTDERNGYWDADV